MMKAALRRRHARGGDKGTRRLQRSSMGDAALKVDYLVSVPCPLSQDFDLVEEIAQIVVPLPDLLVEAAQYVPTRNLIAMRERRALNK